MSAMRLLHVEDSADDAELVRHALEGAPFPFTLTRVDNEVRYREELASAPPDAIICDYNLPGFSAERALEIVRASDLDVPFLVVSHHLGETEAVVAMQNGASDYLPKRNLGRLPKAIASAVDRCNARREKAKAEAALRESEAIRRGILDSILPGIVLVDGAGVILAVNKAWEGFEKARAFGDAEIAGPGANYLDALEAAHRRGTASAAERRALLSECVGAAGGGREKLRQLAMARRPPQLDQLGLKEALEWLAQRQSAASGLPIKCKFAGLEARLPATLESACYRIAQEALSNATRHSKAKLITIGVESDGALLKLAVHDDGIGFDPGEARLRLVRSGSMGLIGMDERAQLAGGRLKVRSVPAAGTTVSAIFPLVERGSHESMSQVAAQG